MRTPVAQPEEPDGGFELLVDENDNTYVLGSSASPDFPCTSTTSLIPTEENRSTFVAMFGPKSGVPDFVACLEPTQVGFLSGAGTMGGLALRPNGRLLVLAGGGVFELSPDHSSFALLGGVPRANRIVIDRAGYIYVAGWTEDPIPEDVGGTRYAIGRNGDFDGFVAKLEPSGKEVLYVVTIGGRRRDILTDIAIDSDGHLFAVGMTESSDFPIQSPFDETCGTDGICNDGSDAFVLSLDLTGTQLRFSTFLGGSGGDSAIHSCPN